MIPDCTPCVPQKIHRNKEGSRGAQSPWGGTRLLTSLVMSPLTSHPFRDGAPFSFQTKKPPTFGRSSRHYYVLYITDCLSCLLPVPAVCGHHISHSIATVSLFSLAYRTLPCQIHLIPPFPLVTHPFRSTILTLSYYMRPILYCCTTLEHMCIHIVTPPTTGMYLPSFS